MASDTAASNALSERFAPQIFVGGPIQHAIAADKTFHAGARSAIETVLLALGRGGHRLLSAHLFENFGEMDVTGMFQDVCRRDFRWMHQCQLFVAVLPLDGNGKAIQSSGTAVELGWASAMGKPIVIVCDPAPVYSHLVTGLDAIARVAKVDINRFDLGEAVCEAVRDLLHAGKAPTSSMVRSTCATEISSKPESGTAA